MRIDDFSERAFADAGIDSQAARALSDDLERYVAGRIQKVADAEMEAIADELNRLGHRLSREPGSENGEIVFFDKDPASGQWHKDIKLRLALDFTVSAGYRHLTPPDRVTS